ncbi:integrase [Bradyrhizobium sp. JR1.7]|uniref:tyrosine-type recombinase/integrase n=1 Tax=unclassified Bradyrhizobium TaxID=2631580 RepID=UPI003391AF76
METDLPYLSRDEDRHGNERVYVRRNGKRIRLKKPEGTVDFAREYAAAVDKLGPPTTQRPEGRTPHAPNTFGWLGTLYFKDKSGFLLLDKDSQRARRNDLEECFAYPHQDDDLDPMGNCPLKHFSAQKAKRLIEAKDGTGARTNRRKHLSALCSWGVENSHLPSNVVRDIKAGTAQKTAGYHTWIIPEVQQYLEHHAGIEPKAAKARLALGLLLFAGTRRQDMVDLGMRNCRGAKANTLGEWIRYVPKKTAKNKPGMSQKPLLPILKAIIEDSVDVLGELTFLETEQGNPFTPAGFGNWFRDRCDEAGLHHCTAHGLKKCGATIAAENGATTHQLMAMFDWDTVRMAEVYTRAANQKRLAGEAMFLISLDRNENENCLTTETATVALGNSGAKSGA